MQTSSTSTEKELEIDGMEMDEHSKPIQFGVGEDNKIEELPEPKNLQDLALIAFCLFDANEDNRISKDELINGMEGLGVTISEEEAFVLMSKGDINKTGSLSFKEFNNLLDLIAKEKNYEFFDSKK